MTNWNMYKGCLELIIQRTFHKNLVTISTNANYK